MPKCLVRRGPCLLISTVLFFSAFTPLHAQDAPAAPDPDVLKALEEIEDESKPLEFRAQLISRLLAGEKEEALEGLRRILLDEHTSADLRLALVGGALSGPRLLLLNDVLGVLAGSNDASFVKEVESRFSWARSSALTRRLYVVAADSEARENLRVSSARLLGVVGGKAALKSLLDLWSEVKAEPVKAAAKEALFEVVPIAFADLDGAKEWWEENQEKSYEQILREGWLKARNGQGSESLTRLLRAFAERLLPDASLENTLTEYVKSPLPDVRRMGAERLSKFPYAQRGGEREAQLRKEAAQGALDALEKEETPEVTRALLAAVRDLVDSARAVDADRALALLTARIDDADRLSALAAVTALGALRDPRAVEPHLCKKYDDLAAVDPEFRLAILDAIERCGDGIGEWITAHLVAGDPEERIMIRLFRLLQGYEHAENRPDAIPLLIGFLSDPEKSAKIRGEAATTLGAFMGRQKSDPRAVLALAKFGLSDPDSSVQVVAATMIGRADPVDDEVVGLLVKSLGADGKSQRVRTAIAGSLLTLRRVDGLAYLKPHLEDDAVWQESARNFLRADLIANGLAAEAVRFVQALSRNGSSNRCVEAARLVLAAENLKWEGDAEGGKGEVAFSLADSLDATGKPKEAREIIESADFPASLASDPAGVERALLLARVTRKTGEPEKVEAILQGILTLQEPPEGALARAMLERSRAWIDRKMYSDAIKALTLLSKDPVYGEEAAALLEKAKAGAAEPPPPVAPPPAETRTLAALIADLDSGEEAARTAAVAGLKEKGKEAHPALLEWLSTKEPPALPAALKLIEAVTGESVPYDPEAPEEERAKALEALKAKLSS